MFEGKPSKTILNSVSTYMNLVKIYLGKVPNAFSFMKIRGGYYFAAKGRKIEFPKFNALNPDIKRRRDKQTKNFR
jgi:hypothetical protein